MTGRQEGGVAREGGGKRFALVTFGCKVNQYDSQVLRDRIEADGYRYTDDVSSADLVVVNSCTVTDEADRRCRQLLRRVLRLNAGARVIVTGCYASRDMRELSAVSERVEAVPDREAVLAGGPPPEPRIERFAGHSRAFVKIQDGCDAFCSYCIVPYVRSRIWSKPPADVLSEIAGLTANGYREIVLSGVHVGRYAYGLDRLLGEIAGLPGDFRVRVSSIEISEVSPGVVGLMRSRPDRVCRHLHLPLQSGADGVLSRMERPYTAGEFARRLADIRRELPDAGVTTDVIVGFPGETDAQFEETRRFVLEGGFSRLHVFTYSPRSGTKAASFGGRISGPVARERRRLLQEADRELQASFLRRFAGTVRPAVAERGSRAFLTDNYIRLEADPAFAGRTGALCEVLVSVRGGKGWAIPSSGSCGPADSSGG